MELLHSSGSVGKEAVRFDYQNILGDYAGKLGSYIGLQLCT